ncbi:MAG TPA: T9SS type A sorting domain-containing protein, partial [Ignavibacteriaceae bacterium]
ELSQNYPNPFNPTTTISFSIPSSTFTSLKIYDILGNELATLVNEVKPAGNYKVNFNAASLSSGTYFYRLSTEKFTQAKKMILLR